MKVWRCTSCGNLVMMPDRPERCYNCRSGDPGGRGLSDSDRLYQQADL